MGTDIPTELLAAQFPRSLLGSLGYAFAVNKNGFVAFHPQLHRHISFLQVRSLQKTILVKKERL